MQSGLSTERVIAGWEFKITCKYNPDLNYIDLVVWERPWQASNDGAWHRTITNGMPWDCWHGRTLKSLRELVLKTFR